ncbi:UDP-N-acetylmuramoyl-tripeptide--D-alanyl-D-alanine ligase [Alkalicaulis satelles]|uniref:UDP-N-acetylmuramoyl-tripeptide--D-alanyl-D-alanine ligase n=1 Tax=Alkalicaulis satelles TaxID=2609175 RepID=A0A5M6ZNZ7_9PROT|nr:UDP-N-acetylmuramoyl-tripeptide--D-alanyl-D-alanine ligase [Alkalicaulis satelles]KAA5805294.1 UDP-N-acetylmuramoyl-tripeptide--D-alanyl-D-alanine ligase [Alkalicaulis satelles]
MTAPLWTAADAALAAGGRLTDGGWSATGVSIDTRTLQPGDLFVALKDARDGHDFARAALDKGAAAVLVSDPACCEGPRLVVDDTLDALRALGQGARLRSPAIRIGVTGSVGKTSVKEALAAILRANGPAHWSVASYNNHWGVPLTLARMPADTRGAVFEMGMNHAGEIAALTAQVRPHVALITRIAPAHLENLGSMEAIAEAKAEIFTGLEVDGVAVIPADDDYAPRLRDAAMRSRAGFLFDFGFARAAAVRVLRYAPDGEGGAGEMDVMGRLRHFRLALPGAHQAVNAAGAVAASLAAGVDPELALETLAGLTPGAGRGARFDVTLSSGRAVTLIDDSYNANPASMRAALSALAQRTPDAGARRVAVLGEMLELGPDAPALHAALAAPLAEAGVELVIGVGAGMSALIKALPAGMEGVSAKDWNSGLEQFQALARQGDIVLIKGSNASGVHKIAAAVKSVRAAAPNEA